MKRFIPLFLLLVFATACQVQVDVVRVRISPSSVTLSPNESVTLTATVLNSAELGTFNWTATAGTLSSTTGASSIYTAPAVGGEFKITASSSLTPLSATTNVSVVEPVTAIASADNAVIAAESLNAFSKKIYRITVPNSLNQPLLYFELGTESSNLSITLYDEDKDAIASSNSKTHFSEKRFGSLALESQVITTNVSCRGPCIIVKNTDSTFYLEIESTVVGGNYDLFVFDDIYQDSAEPDDSNCSNLALKSAAIVTKVNTTAAIETLDDIDCFPFGEVTNINVATLASTAIDLDIKIFVNNQLLDNQKIGRDDAYNLVFQTPTSGTIVITGDGEAGPSASSRYTVKAE